MSAPTTVPYFRPAIGPDEVAAVTECLESGWVTTGPRVGRFQDEFAAYVGAKHAIGTNSCTMGLQIALSALGVGPGDRVIVPTMTFAATANVVKHVGAEVVLVDCDEDGQISLDDVRKSIDERTKAVIPVHYGGQACDLLELYALTSERNIAVLEDAAHAAGCEYRGDPIGMTGTASFSFYATKNMTTGEGGMVTTNDDVLAERLRLLSLHGLSANAWNRYSDKGTWRYEVVEAGWKANMTDVAAALGLVQLARLDGFMTRRREIGSAYNEAFAGLPVRTPRDRLQRPFGYHLYPLQVEGGERERDALIDDLGEAGIGTSVHFIPLHRHKAYAHHRSRFPNAEHMFAGLVSLPLYPGMTDEQVGYVIDAVTRLVTRSRAKVFGDGRAAA